jgi:DHA2 family lincomycin resistance protein-like MFS transporter
MNSQKSEISNSKSVLPLEFETPAGGNVAILVLLLSTFIVLLNEMLMGVALPRLMQDLDISASKAQWLTTGYMLTMSVVIPMTGYLTERFTMRALFTGAMIAFSVGTVAAALAPSFELLLVGRVIQALGTAVVVPLLYTGINTLVPPQDRGSKMAFATVAIAIAPSAGPLVSGFILSVASWRWLFIAIAPSAFICTVLGYSLIKVTSDEKRPRLDGTSVLLSIVGFASLVYGLSAFGEASSARTNISPWLYVLVGLLFIGVFALRQNHLQKTNQALLDLRPFLTRNFVLPAVIMVLFMLPTNGMFALMPVIIQSSYGLDPIHAGLFMAPAGLLIAASSAVVGHTYARIGPRNLICIGAVIDAFGLLLLSRIQPGSSIWLTLAALGIKVFGQAILWTSSFAVSLGSLDKHLLPHGSAIANTIAQLIGAAGIAIAFSIAGTKSASFVASGLRASDGFASGAQTFYLIGVGMVVCAFIIGLFLPKQTVASELPVAVH